MTRLRGLIIPTLKMTNSTHLLKSIFRTAHAVYFLLRLRAEEIAVKFMDSLKLCDIETHVADAKTCILHPASHTHRQMTDEQLIEAGVAPDLIRLSVGLENVDDLIADISQALDKI